MKNSEKLYKPNKPTGEQAYYTVNRRSCMCCKYDFSTVEKLFISTKYL